MGTYRAMWRKYREAIATGNKATYKIAYRLAELVVKNGRVPGCRNAVEEAVFILTNRRY